MTYGGERSQPEAGRAFLGNHFARARARAGVANQSGAIIGTDSGELGDLRLHLPPRKWLSPSRSPG
jgi:hypothetical protein